MKKRFFALSCLACLMAAFALAGCASRQPDGDDAASGATETAASAQPESATPRRAPLPAEKRPVTAVFNFDVKSTDPAHETMGIDVAQALTEALLRGQILKPVEREQMNKIVKEQDLSLSGYVREEDAIRIGNMMGAKYILLGTVTVLAPQARINARLLDVETGEIVVAESSRGQLAAIYDVEDELARKLEAPIF